MENNENINGPARKNEKSLEVNEKFETAIASLKGLAGPEFIQQLRELNEDPEFEKYVESYTGDKRLLKDISSGLFFVKQEKADESNFGSTFYKTELEPHYYPENTKKDRRYERRMWGGIGGVMGTLAIAGAVSYYEMEKNFAEDKEAEKEWINQKLPLSVTEIKEQADTIFQKLKGNFYLFSAWDTLNQTVDKHFAEQGILLEKNAKDEIISSIDSLQSSNPEVFKDLVFGYWKSKNGMPSDYYDVAYYPVNAEKTINDLKAKFRKDRNEMKNEHDALLQKLYLGYKNAGGDVMSWLEAQEVHKKAQAKKVEHPVKAEKTENKETITPEQAQFTANVDELAKSYMDEYLKVFGTPLADEVEKLQRSEEKILDDIKDEYEKKKSELEFEHSKKVQAVRNQASTDKTKEQEGLSKDAWAYFEDYYLVNEVFSEYEGIKDTASVNELKVLEKDPAVTDILKNIHSENTEAQKNLAEKIKEINTEFEIQKQEMMPMIQHAHTAELFSVKEKLAEKAKRYEDAIRDARREYREKYMTIWNAEIIKLNNTSINALEKSFLE